MKFQAGRIDNAYQATSDLNNTIKASLDTLEKNILNLGDSMQAIKNRLKDVNTYYWIVESFNNTSNVDTNRSTAFVDTDYGDVRLVPLSNESISNFTLSVQQEETIGLPGANLLVAHVGAGSADSEPKVTLITENTYDLGNVLDGDPQTKFECERNFILAKQKALKLGHAYKSDDTGQIIDVAAVTNDLDFKIVVKWPDGNVVGDGIATRLADYVDVDPSTTSKNNVEFCFNIVFDAPTFISTLRLAPFSRNNASINVERIIVQTEDGQYFNLAKNISLTDGNSFTALQAAVNKRTGSQSVGTLFYSPTNKAIVNMNIKLSSPPVQAYLSHPFVDAHMQRRSERHYVFFSSVDYYDWWERHPVNSTPVEIDSQVTNPKLLGSTATQILGILLGAGQSAASVGSAGNISAGQAAVGGVAGALGGLASSPLVNQAIQLGAAKSLIGSLGGGVFGGVGGFLAKAVPYVGALLLLSDIIGGFGFSKTFTDLEDVKGYDVFYGWRAAVGISDLSVGRETYIGTGEIYSTKRQFLVPVTRIGLYVEENIPSDWGSGDWVQYFISVDGNNWMPIDKTSGSDFSKALVLSSPSQDVYFKAILTANGSDIYRSPILNHYTLQGLP